MSLSGRSLVRLPKHMVKQKIQPERAGSSWRGSIANAPTEISLHFEDPPSLRRHWLNTLDANWQKAVKEALAGTHLIARANEFELWPH